MADWLAVPIVATVDIPSGKVTSNSDVDATVDDGFLSAALRMPFHQLEKTDAAVVVQRRLEPIDDAEEACWRVAMLLCDENQDVRVETLKAIARMGESGALHAREVAYHLRSRWTGQGADSNLRCMATKALGAMGEAAAAHAGCLTDMLASEDIDERTHAVIALAAMGEEVGCEDKLRFIRKVAAMGEAGGMHLHAVEPFLSDASAEVRAEAVKVFARLGVAGAAHADAVAQLLDDDQLSVRRAAPAVLALMGEAGAAHADAVARLLHEEDDDLCGAACWALARMGEAGAAHAGAVAILLTDENAFARVTAVEALSGMGAAGAAHAPAVALLLGDENNVVRQWAAKALAIFNEQGACN